MPCPSTSHLICAHSVCPASSRFATHGVFHHPSPFGICASSLVARHISPCMTTWRRSSRRKSSSIIVSTHTLRLLLHYTYTLTHLPLYLCLYYAHTCTYACVYMYIRVYLQAKLEKAELKNAQLERLNAEFQRRELTHEAKECSDALGAHPAPSCQQAQQPSTMPSCSRPYGLHAPCCITLIPPMPSAQSSVS